jgi:hypothetical protein
MAKPSFEAAKASMFATALFSTADEPVTARLVEVELSVPSLHQFCAES